MGKKCHSQQGHYKLYWNKLNKYSETNLNNILRKQTSMENIKKDLSGCLDLYSGLNASGSPLEF